MLTRPVAYYVEFHLVTGDPHAALLLSQAWYWSQRTSDPDGWFWKTRQQWKAETGLSRFNQETARRILNEWDFWSEEKRGNQGRVWFRVDEALLSHAIELRFLERLDSAISLYSEKTEENLTEITTEARLKNAENSESSETKMVNRDELAQQLALHGVGAHQIAPAIEKHAHELKRRLDFLPYVQIRKSAAAFLMNELTRPYSEPPEWSAARAHQRALDVEAIESLLGRAARAKAMA